MTKFLYNQLKKISKPIEIEPYLKIYYDIYINNLSKMNIEQKINEEDFKKIIAIIFEVLSVCLTEKQIVKVLNSYVGNLIADNKDGSNVDISWAIKYIWYLTATTCTTEFANWIPFVQQQLIDEFEIEETIKEKVKRKIYIRTMI